MLFEWTAWITDPEQRNSRLLLAAHAVDHAAGPEEQQGFEERMGEEMEHTGRVSAGGDRHHHVAELGDGRIGQDFLDVVRHQGQ